MHKRLVLLGICVAVALAAVALKGVSPAVGAGGGTISGTVYVDTNMNGQRDPGEPPESGQTVNLTIDPDETRVVESMKTGSDGRYSFTGLAAAVGYTVMLAPDSKDFCWDDGGWSVSGEQTITDADLWVVEKGPAAVSGTMFDDVNEDSVVDSGERGLAGWSLDIRAGTFCLASVIADPRGHYELTGMPQAVYDLVPQWPAAVPEQAGYWEQTAPLRPWGDYSPVAGLQVPAQVDLSEKREVRNIDVGLHFVTGSGSISVSLFSDSDRDQVKDPGEPPADCILTVFFRLARKLSTGVPVYLDGVFPACQDGRLEIDGLPAGTYNVGLESGCDSPNLVTPNQWVTLQDGQQLKGLNLATCPVTVEPSPTPQLPPVTVVPTSVPAAATAHITSPNTGSGQPAATGETLPAAFALALLGGAFVVAARRRIHRRKSP